MDRIQLRFHDFWHHLWPGPQLLIHINGQSLITLVRQVEMPFAREEGAPYLAGAYDWLLSVECDMHRLTTEWCLVPLHQRRTHGRLRSSAATFAAVTGHGPPISTPTTCATSHQADPAPGGTPSRSRVRRSGWPL
jgi:hypothetical protein